MSCFYIWFKTDYLDIKKISVTNRDGTQLDNLTESEVVSWSRRAVGENNFFQAKLTDIENEITPLSPYIKKVYVNKRFPNKLTVEVDERLPVLGVVIGPKCILVDIEGIVLESPGEGAEGESDDAGCFELFSRHQVPYLIGEGIKANFEVGKESSFYELDDLLLMLAVVEDQGYKLLYIEWNDGIYTAKLDEGNVLIFSNAQEMELQLKRFVVVAERIQFDHMRFTSLDLRYKRPVMTR